MPSLTVKAAAELLRVPAYTQVRILTQQKYPKSGSQVFRTPFYRVALGGIRSYFYHGNSKKQIQIAKSKAHSLSQAAKRDNNKRVLNAFASSSFAKRQLEPIKNSQFLGTIGGVDFRLSSDLHVLENDKARVIYINCRAEELDPEIARLTLEIAYWVLRQNNQHIPMGQLEFIDLFRNKRYCFKTARKRTIPSLRQNAKIIDAVWPSL